MVRLAARGGATRTTGETATGSTPRDNEAGTHNEGRTAAWLQELLPWADALLAAGSLEFYAGLATAVKQARYGLRRGFAQVLYPATILCGTGACQACAADVAGGRRRVCLRGPVFDLADLEP